jgi:isoaspartyl peptidase/L-asparaginase-like protein (Ntn-hydrolase superfamily)
MEVSSDQGSGLGFDPNLQCSSLVTRACKQSLESLIRNHRDNYALIAVEEAIVVMEDDTCLNAGVY